VSHLATGNYGTHIEVFAKACITIAYT